MLINTLDILDYTTEEEYEAHMQEVINFCDYLNQKEEQYPFCFISINEKRVEKHELTEIIDVLECTNFKNGINVYLDEKNGTLHFQSYGDMFEQNGEVHYQTTYIDITIPQDFAKSFIEDVLSIKQQLEQEYSSLFKGKDIC